MNHQACEAYAGEVSPGGPIARHVTPKLDPLPRSTSTYRDGSGRLRRLSVIGIPRKEIDLDRYVSALLALAMHRVEDEDRQQAVLRGDVKLLPPGDT